MSNMGMNVLHLVLCCLAVTTFLSTSVNGCGRSKPSGECTDSEYDVGTCEQNDESDIREWALYGNTDRTMLTKTNKYQVFRVLRNDEDPDKLPKMKTLQGPCNRM
ncbi:hypothetical protein DPMN_055881 [Dreissena polymorpha]|uniref:Secreted protein n=1 Tax=Dreissena polymorpha TaxID=45954 RepID=A0A9D4CQQ7_DREPO|nr:hypothetical protein DPMN_055881 [Dreissena polymorpha]